MNCRARLITFNWEPSPYARDVMLVSAELALESGAIMTIAKTPLPLDEIRRWQYAIQGNHTFDLSLGPQEACHCRSIKNLAGQELGTAHAPGCPVGDL